MNQKNNHEDYSLNIWLSISILAPLLDFIFKIINGESYVETGGIGVLIFIIFAVMMTGLPIYFLLIKFSKKVFDFKISNWQVKLILLILVFFFIIAIHLLFLHKPLVIAGYSRCTPNFQYLCFFYLLCYSARFYLFAALISIFYFKINRNEYLPPLTSQQDILDDDLDFKK